MPIVSGNHAVYEALRARKKGTLHLEQGHRRIKEFTEVAQYSGITVRMYKRGDLLRKGFPQRTYMTVSNDKTEAISSLDTWLKQSPPRTAILLLDHITDPHNYGAILRSAEQFSIDLVITPRTSSASDTATVARASSGALFRVPIFRSGSFHNVIRILQKHDFIVYGLDMQGIALSEITFHEKTALILGSEGKGMQSSLRAKCDYMARVPTNGKLDSLNVSIVAGIACYSIFLQHGADSL